MKSFGLESVLRLRVYVFYVIISPIFLGLTLGSSTAFAQPYISLSSVSALEGDSGYTDFVFEATLSEPSSLTITGDYSTGDGSATSPDDFIATSGTLTFPPGETTQTFTVQVKGDTEVEGDETFAIDLTDFYVSGYLDILGLLAALTAGTILNDDPNYPPVVPKISFSILSAPEGDSGTTDFVFEATLSEPTTLTVTGDYSTVDGSATSPDDFIATSGTLTFSPGTTTQTFTVQVNGDTEFEEDETFGFDLSDFYVSGYLDLSDLMRWLDGAGTILNDDTPDLPDLYDDGESYSSFSPNEIKSGQTLEIHCRIRNGGDQESGPFKVRFYASDDSEINARGSLADYFIGDVEISNIPVGETANCDWNGPFPTSIEAGEYYVENMERPALRL